jgi:hypothetical protein
VRRPSCCSTGFTATDEAQSIPLILADLGRSGQLRADLTLDRSVRGW